MAEKTEYREGQIVAARINGEAVAGTILEVCWDEGKRRYEYVLSCDRWVTADQITAVTGEEFC